MKNFLIVLILIFIVIIIPTNNVYSGVCSGYLNANYSLLDTDAIYNPGEIVNTDLSLEVRGDDTIMTMNNPLAIVLTMDRSGSMANDMDQAKESLISVVDRISSFNNSDNKLALVTFNNSVTLDQALTSNFNLLRLKINSFSASGNTSIGGALVTSASAISEANQGNSKYIIIASDGIHNSNPAVQAGIGSVPLDVTVHTIGIGRNVDSLTMEEIAANSGTRKGEYFFASDISQLTGVLNDIINSILTFEASNFEVTFARDNAKNVIYDSSNPVYLSADTSRESLTWGLGVMKDGDSKNINIKYKVSSYSPDDILLNKQTLNYSYEDLDGTMCNLSTTVNPLSIITPCQSPTIYTCSQSMPDCSNVVCGEEEARIRTCVKKDSCLGTHNQVDISECISSGVSCDEKKVICKDNCIRKTTNYLEVMP